MVNRITSFGEVVVLDGSRISGNDCGSVGKGFRIFLGSARMLRDTVDKNGGNGPTRLDITFITPLPFFHFEHIGYSKIGVVSAFAPKGRPSG